MATLKIKHHKFGIVHQWAVHFAPTEVTVDSQSEKEMTNGKDNISTYPKNCEILFSGEFLSIRFHSRNFGSFCMDGKHPLAKGLLSHSKVVEYNFVERSQLSEVAKRIQHCFTHLRTEA